MGSFSPTVAKQVGAWRELEAQLLQLAGGDGLILVHSSKAWASTTFQGERHSLTIAFDGLTAVERGHGLIAELPEHEFTIAGQLVAEATLTSADGRADPPRLTAELEILLLEQD